MDLDPSEHYFGFHLKVSKFQNEFMKSSFLPKYEPNIVRISTLYCATLQGRNPSLQLLDFGSYFGRNDDFNNSCWNLLTFTAKVTKGVIILKGSSNFKWGQDGPKVNLLKIQNCSDFLVKATMTSYLWALL